MWVFRLSKGNNQLVHPPDSWTIYKLLYKQLQSLVLQDLPHIQKYIHCALYLLYFNINKYQLWDTR